MQKFTETVLQIIKEIPNGKVMTYGQVAASAGSPRAARQVARLLHSMSSKHQLPWHRVVNIKGEIALQQEDSKLTQREFLEAEGVEVDSNGRIDLKRYRHDPGE